MFEAMGCWLQLWSSSFHKSTYVITAERGISKMLRSTSNPRKTGHLDYFEQFILVYELVREDNKAWEANLPCGKRTYADGGALYIQRSSVRSDPLLSCLKSEYWGASTSYHTAIDQNWRYNHPSFYSSRTCIPPPAKTGPIRANRTCLHILQSSRA